MALMEVRRLPLRRYWPRRFSVIALCALSIFICYIDRVNISVTIIPMAEEFGWDDQTQAAVLSSFFLGYMMTQILGGWLANRFGGKAVLAMGVVFWSLLTILTPPAAALGLTVLLLCRIAMGLGEGVAFPAVYNMLGKWVPESERSRSIGIVFSAIPLGTVFALLISPLIVLSLGWEWVFYLFGAVGFLWWYFWHKLVESDPSQHQRMAYFERRAISGGVATSADQSETPWKAMLSSTAVWAIIISHFCTNWASYVLLALLPKYLIEELGVEFAAVGLFAILPSIASVFAVNFGGYAADTAIARGIPKIRVRKTCQFIAFGGVAAAMIAVAGISSAPAAIFVMCIGNIMAGFGAGGFAVNHLDIAPRHAGVLMGLTNTAGTVPGFLGVLISGVILQATGSWEPVFYLAAGVCLVGLVVYMVFAKTEVMFD